jgi:hypothetical protein
MSTRPLTVPVSQVGKIEGSAIPVQTWITLSTVIRISGVLKPANKYTGYPIPGTEALSRIT